MGKTAITVRPVRGTKAMILVTHAAMGGKKDVRTVRGIDELIQAIRSQDGVALISFATEDFIRFVETWTRS